MQSLLIRYLSLVIRVLAEVGHDIVIFVRKAYELVTVITCPLVMLYSFSISHNAPNLNPLLPHSCTLHIQLKHLSQHPPQHRLRRTPNIRPPRIPVSYTHLTLPTKRIV